MKERIVILGFMSHFPVAGVAWQTIHYHIGLQRLRFDVSYVEAHGCTPSKLMQSDTDDGSARAAAYLAGVLGRFGLGRNWAYHAPYPVSRYFGLTETQLRELYRSAACIINLHGSHIPVEELTATNRLVYLETDPVDVQIDLHHNHAETLRYLSPHCAFLTYGENFGNPDCRVPAPTQFRFLATRQPVVLDFWEAQAGTEAALFTTVGNWQQPWRQVKFNGEIYRWSKHFEFLKFIDLPRRVQQPFELALSSYEPKDQALLESKGWRIRHAMDFSQDLDRYRDYIRGSRGEFTVAKDQNIRLRSGWFSDRAATYLAAGRPVITQETGFSNILPTGEGLFAFATMEELVASVEAINADYERHRRAALQIARDCFGHDVVLGRMLNDLGLSRPRGRSCTTRTNSPSPIPSDLVLTPTGRWPTRLPDETVRTALALPVPNPGLAHPAADNVAPSSALRPPSSATRASVILVTYNGLVYTKLCLASLFAHGWDARDEVIIVDNRSTDGTQLYLKELARVNPFVRIQLNETNRGFAAATNQGLSLARGNVFVLLNCDTLPPAGWLESLLGRLREPSVGLVGPVTNRVCNEAQIDSTYRTYGEMERFAQAYTRQHHTEVSELPMLAMFCVALRRDVFQKVGPLDEQFEIGMFEDDDYSRRVRQSGYKILCAEDAFVHHFGQGSFGELCVSGEYDRILAANRRRFEEKWHVAWQPHGRRLTPEYQALRQRIRETIESRLSRIAPVAVISKGDDDLLQLNGHPGWHFPQRPDGSCPHLYPADSGEAISHLESVRAKGAGYLLIPKPAFWWLEHYGEFHSHLEQRYALKVREPDICLVYDLGGDNV